MFSDDSSLADDAKVVRFIRRNLQDSFPKVNLTQYRTSGSIGLRHKVAKLLNRTQLTGFQRRGNPTRTWNASLVQF